jgi:hypothetical protein
VRVKLGSVLLDEIGEVPIFVGGLSGQDGVSWVSTTIRV